MTIDEAIKNLTADLSDEVGTEMIDIDSALKLGIEALKRINIDRNLGMPWAISQLPGETK